MHQYMAYRDRCMGLETEGETRHRHHAGPAGACMGSAGGQWGSMFEGSQGITRRFLRPVVLLLLAESPIHGYELMGNLKEFGFDRAGMDPSILYRLLRHIEREGLTESSLDDSGSGPARKVYTLTPEGQEILDLWAASIDDTINFLGQFKDRYEKLGER